MVRNPFPFEFLPIDADPVRLLVLADWCEEHGRNELARHLRATARLWQRNAGLPRRLVRRGMSVWARYSSIGWSRAVVSCVTSERIFLAFPYRPRRYHASIPDPAQPGPGPHRHEAFILREVHGQSGERAWWDLEPRGDWDGRRFWEKPAPRRGYGAVTNAAIAAALMGAREVRALPHVSRSMEEAQ